MSDYYSDPVIESPAATLPSPSEHAVAPESLEAINGLRDEIFDRIANDDSGRADDYVEERKDREADARGEKLSPHREEERLKRYIKALETAGDDFTHHAHEQLTGERDQNLDLQRRDRAVERNTRHEMRVEAFERQHPDYRQTVQGVFSALPMGDHVAEALVESGRSAELAYAIAQRISAHPDPIAAMNGINSMTPEALKLDLARIEGALAERDRTAQQSPPPRRVTRAPPPIKTPRGGASPAFDASTASMEEYAARRKAGWRG